MLSALRLKHRSLVVTLLLSVALLLAGGSFWFFGVEHNAGAAASQPNVNSVGTGPYTPNNGGVVAGQSTPVSTGPCTPNNSGATPRQSPPVVPSVGTPNNGGAAPVQSDPNVNSVTTGPYTATFAVDTGLASNSFTNMIAQGKNMFVYAFPKEAQRWNSGVKSVQVLFSSSLLDAAAVTTGNTVTVNATYALQNPLDIPGVLTHEWAHVAQGYGNNNVPGWFVEGMADYARFTYGPNDSSFLPSGVNAGDNYTSAYRVTARFLLWSEKHIDPNLVDKINTLAQQNRYGQDAFQTVTGRTVDQLWSQYVANPTI